MFDAPQTNSDAAGSDAGQSGVSQDQDQNLTQGEGDIDLLADSSAGDGEPSQEEQDEIEVAGKKFALPKSAAEQLKSERMMHADYTQKTQTAAAERQQLTAAREQFQQQQQQHQGYIQDIAKVVALDDQLAQFRALDMQKIIAEDPQYAMQLQQAASDLQNKRAAAAQSVAQKQQQLALDQQQDTAKQVQDANAYLAREIKGFGKERSDQLFNYGVAMGIEGAALTQAILKSPALGVALHKAELYDALLKKQAPKPAPQAQAKPVPQVGGNATVKKDPSKMSDREFAEWRRKSSQRK